MISEEDVKHIAKLSRVGLNSKELKEFQRELDSVLNYFKKLDEIDVSRVEIGNASGAFGNATREDRVMVAQEDSKKIIGLIPAEREGFLKVKSIL